MKTLIDFIYTVLIGVSVVLFVGLGIWTFYSGPKAPKYPDYPTTSISGPTDDQNKEYDKHMKAYQAQNKKYEAANKKYAQKVSVAGLVIGLAFFIGGLLLMKKGFIISEGLALGGVFTAGYAAVWGSISGVKGLVFAAVTVILAMLIMLVQYRARFQKR